MVFISNIAYETRWPELKTLLRDKCGEVDTSLTYHWEKSEEEKDEYESEGRKSELDILPG